MFYFSWATSFADNGFGRLKFFSYIQNSKYKLIHTVILYDPCRRTNINYSSAIILKCFKSCINQKSEKLKNISNPYQGKHERKLPTNAQENMTINYQTTCQQLRTSIFFFILKLVNCSQQVLGDIITLQLFFYNFSF